MSVNAYDEDRVDVERFIDEGGFTFPVLLNGSAVAKDLFHAPSFPANYLINAGGLVVHRSFGFDEIAAARTEELIEELLRR